MPVFSLFAGSVPPGFLGTCNQRPATAYRNNPIVFRCVRLISEAIDALPMLAYEGKLEMDQHPVLALLRSPGAGDTTSRFVEQVSATLLLYGDCFVHFVSVDQELRE